MFTQELNYAIKQLMQQGHSYTFSKWAITVSCWTLLYVVLAWYVSVIVALFGLYGFWAGAAFISMVAAVVFSSRRLWNVVNKLLIVQEGQRIQIDLLIEASSGLSRKVHNMQRFLQRLSRTTTSTRSSTLH